MSHAMLASKSTAPAAGSSAVASARSGGLRISEPDDAFEKEVDQVADESLGTATRGQ
jgi:hypothetical protein